MSYGMINIPQWNHFKCGKKRTQDKTTGRKILDGNQVGVANKINDTGRNKKEYWKLGKIKQKSSGGSCQKHENYTIKVKPNGHQIY